ncbi:MAG: HIT family protein [Robiginitomaculum sp.]|nr:MAG: HIT family protein [Robiginitomaculum sp.]
MTFTLHPQLAKDGLDLGDFEISKLLMIKDVAYPWFVLVPRVANIKDAHELDEQTHMQVLRESRALCAALMTAFVGTKMNVAALGNMVPQLHIHHIVRAPSDPAWPAPVWGVQPLTPLTEHQILERVQRLKRAFEGVSHCPAWA